MIWRFYLTARHILENLATDLYQSWKDCLWEIVRNGVCACFPGTDWVPGVGFVEITLVENHPLAPRSTALVILDHGTGFTDPSIKRFCHIGPSLDDTKQFGRGLHHGASQKRIGRFAAFALNRRCVEDEDTDSGFYILTRTSSEGPVKFVSMIPSEIERKEGVEPREISPQSTEMGPLRGIKGSFSAIIIPNPVVKNYEEIREALKWRIPRKPGLMFKLLIGGKQLNPPSLDSRVVVAEKTGSIEAYLDRIPDRTEAAGIWLCDAETGLRVVFCPRLGHLLIPEPLWRTDLVGDIFIPDLLAHQDTARRSLNGKFLGGRKWKAHCAYLLAHVAPKARALVKKEDEFGSDAFTRLVKEFAEQCQEVFGPPEHSNGGTPWDHETAARKEGSGEGTKRPGAGGGGGEKPSRQPDSENKETRPRSWPIRIGDQDYVLSKRALDPRFLAQVDGNNKRVIYLNERGYAAMPRGQSAQVEHFLLKVLEAVGQAMHGSDPVAVTQFVAERRLEFLKRHL